MSSSLDVEPFESFPLPTESEEPSRNDRIEVRPVPGHGLIGESQNIHNINDRLARVAPTDLPVFIEGEIGTGKEVLARALHAASSRAAGPFRVIRFKGASDQGPSPEWIGDGAVGGTWVLSEIAEAPLATQARLVRLLEEIDGNVGSHRSAAVRLITTTSIDLERAVAEGRFRADLFHALHVVPLQLLPLRQRVDDVVPLAEYFARSEGLRLQGRELRLQRDAASVLEAHRWPGNVRELKNVIRAALIGATGTTLGAADIEPLVFATPLSANRWEDFFRDQVRETLGEGVAHRTLLDAAERLILKEALTRSAGNKVRAAGLLGIHRNSLSRRVAVLGVAQ